MFFAAKKLLPNVIVLYNLLAINDAVNAQNKTRSINTDPLADPQVISKKFSEDPKGLQSRILDSIGAKPFGSNSQNFLRFT